VTFNPNCTNRPSVRFRIGAVALSICIALSSATAFAQSDEPAPDTKGPDITGPVVTTPPAPGAPSPTSSETNGIATIAKMEGMTIPQAEAFIANQDKLTSFADTFRANNADYVDFSLTPDGRAGILVLAPGGKARQTGRLATSKSLAVTVSEAPLSAADQVTETERVAQQLRGSGQTFSSIAYDAINDRYLIGTPPTTNMATLERSARNVGVSVEVRSTEGITDFYGGQALDKLGNSFAVDCTSGFGMYNNNNGQVGYLTTGHCGTGSWKVRNVTSSAVEQRSVGGYQDRQIIRANGGSCQVATTYSPTAGTVYTDMSSVGTQVYNNTYYCTYSAQTRKQSCGNTVDYNIPSPNNTLAWETTARCKPGDSGGPFWRPVTGGESRPAGIVKGGDTSIAPDSDGRYACNFMKLIDQIPTGGWVLL